MRAGHWLGSVILCLATLVACHFGTFRHLYPGQWCGQLGMFVFPVWVFLVPLVSFALGALLLRGKKQVVPMIMITLSVMTPCIMPVRPNPETRFNVEKAQYLEAARTGGQFGDQNVELIDGRKLIYWRWASWGIDNAIGVIYDPQDRFVQGADGELDRSNDDSVAFRKAAGGSLWSSQRMGDGLYLVTHT